jgi:PhnB protein
MPKKSAAKSKKVAARKPAALKPAARAAAKSNGKKASAKSAPKKKVQAVPPQYGSATPHLIVSPCTEALDFYVKAFGAKVTSKMPGPGGILMHAEMKIGDSIVMLADEQPGIPGQPMSARKTPKNAGATTGGVMLYVKDVDALFERAVAAGGTATMPPQDMFWGDRYGQVEDPFGHVWAVATHQRDVTAREMKSAMAQMGAPDA